MEVSKTRRIIVKKGGDRYTISVITYFTIKIDVLGTVLVFDETIEAYHANLDDLDVKKMVRAVENREKSVVSFYEELEEKLIRAVAILQVQSIVMKERYY